MEDHPRPYIGRQRLGSPTLLMLRTFCGRSWREAVATHDFRQLCSVGWATGRRVDYLCRLPEILRSYRCRGNQAERFYLMDPMVIEPVNGAAGNAQCLSRADLNLFSIDGPGRHSLDAVDRFFVMLVAMGRSCQALRTRDNELKCRYAAT